MMKRYIPFLFVILFLGVPFVASAQQEPKWNHYMFNDFFYNPAAAGSRGKISTFLIHRYQWVNLPDNASPRTTVLSVHAPAKFLHGGIGLMVNTDQDFLMKPPIFGLHMPTVPIGRMVNWESVLISVASKVF